MSSSLSSLWDACNNLDPVLLTCLDEIDAKCIPYSNTSSSVTSSSVPLSSSSSSSSSTTTAAAAAKTAPSSSSRSNIDNLQSSLSSAELSCKDFMNELDDILRILDEVLLSHRDVTGRTNSLMHSCESLLEQQHTLQATSEILKTTLAPFDDIEDIAVLLGIPIDTKSNDNKPIVTNDNPVDPRSPEFQTALEKIVKTLLFVNQHPEFRDNERYHRWLIQLQNRATSIVARGMKELLENSKKACVDILNQQKLKQNASNAAAGNKSKIQVNIEGQPLEASPIYQKFRGLGFRMRELSALLYVGYEKESKRGNVDSDKNGSNIHTANDILRDVKQTYILIRCELLMPFMKDSTLSIISLPQLSTSSSSSLCPGIRHAYSTLLRITQLEFQLAETLFYSQDDSKGDTKNKETGSNVEVTQKIIKDRKSDSNNDQSEVFSIVTAICNATCDYLRPLIIRESDVDELCRVVTTLAEDVKTQILALNVPKPVIVEVIRCLNRTVSDSQERLAYCAEIKLRQDIQLFEPSTEQTAYPEILEKSVANGNDEGAETLEIISKTWYPPLRATLALLSKLYGVVEVVVFEDFARRSVDFCVATLKHGSDQVKKKKLQNQGHMHGDLFLVRHLLLLREQLLPFDIRLQSIEKKLDFQPTGVALAQLAKNSRNLLRFDSANGLIQLAWEGLPGLQETQLDARKDLDYVLKNSCLSLKQNAVKMLLGPSDGFLSKVVAFIGEIPISSSLSSSMLVNDSSDIPLLSSENRQMLKSQAFVRAERIKEVLEQSKEHGNVSGLQLKNMMTLYVDNSIARTILLKPIQQEIDNTKKRLLCVINSCVDPGQHLRDLDQLLTEFIDIISSHLI